MPAIGKNIKSNKNSRRKVLVPSAAIISDLNTPKPLQSGDKRKSGKRFVHTRLQHSHFP